MNTMKLIGTAVIVVFFATTISEAQTSSGLHTIRPSAAPTISIDDVARFYRVYDAANGHPTADQLQHEYIDEGSAGLLQFAKMRHISGVSIAKNLAEHPEMYSNARSCEVVLPRVRERVRIALRKLREIYPEAKFPPVTIAVGHGKPVGVGSPVSGVQIGLESLCAVKWMNPDVEDRFAHVIAHEYVHVQQVRALVDDEHPTVLEGSLVEGAADFIAKLISGGLAYSELPAAARGHEKQIETEFLSDESKTDISKWLYNSTADKRGDLGYWVGYRIVISFYQQAANKRDALRDILQMSDPKEFLAKSGWHPGNSLQR